jgi:hypothetical protein
MNENIFSFKKYGFSFRLVEIEDAQFILELRTNPRLARNLSTTSLRLEDQQHWISEYKKRESERKEFYFLTLDEKGEKLGVNRIYNCDEESFEIGSWVFLPDLLITTSIFGDLAVRDFGFEVLSYKYCRFELLRSNRPVLKYHLEFKPDLISEDETKFYFRLSREKFYKHRDKLLKMIYY